jgi:hypothetical protein
MAADGDVVVTGVVDAGIPRFVDRDTDNAVLIAQGVEIFGRIEVVVDVNDHRRRGG